MLFWQEVQRYKVRGAGRAPRSRAGESGAGSAAVRSAGIHVQLPLINNGEK